MKLYNTLTKTLEDFKSIKDNKVTIYVCGITPYDTTHLGHAFLYISFDALIRYLKLLGFQVTYTQNVTDINDRDKDILQRAKEQNIPWSKLAEHWTKLFLKDMKNLNWTPPAYYLKASEQIPSVIVLIERLLRNGLAYQLNESVYLDISKVKDHGKLSKLTQKQMLKVSQDFEEDLKNPDKKHPLDITLWRSSTPNQPDHIPSFDSPFGKGRPGWHIECSAMSMKTLGEQIDIHGGGSDLIFPHHEAEITQSEAATNQIPFVKYWLHAGIVAYRGEKMSKTKGNLVWVSDLLKKYSANAIRMLLLSNHWHNTWEYFEQDLIKAQKNVELIESAFNGTNELTGNDQTTDEFSQIMDNNLDTPKALKLLLELAQNHMATDLKRLYATLGFRNYHL